MKGRLYRRDNPDSCLPMIKEDSDWMRTQTKQKTGLSKKCRQSFLLYRGRLWRSEICVYLT